MLNIYAPGWRELCGRLFGHLSLELAFKFVVHPEVAVANCPDDQKAVYFGILVQQPTRYHFYRLHSAVRAETMISPLRSFKAERMLSSTLSTTEYQASSATRFCVSQSIPVCGRLSFIMLGSALLEAFILFVGEQAGARLNGHALVHPSPDIPPDQAIPEMGFVVFG